MKANPCQATQASQPLSTKLVSNSCKNYLCHATNVNESMSSHLSQPTPINSCQATMSGNPCRSTHARQPVTISLCVCNPYRPTHVNQSISGNQCQAANAVQPMSTNPCQVIHASQRTPPTRVKQPFQPTHVKQSNLCQQPMLGIHVRQPTSTEQCQATIVNQPMSANPSQQTHVS